MGKRIMDFQFLLDSEIETKSVTSKYIPLAESTIENFINLFFKYHYFMKENYIDESDEHYFHSFAYYTYIRMPYNVRSIYQIWEQGYYLESLILLRHIVESYIQLRYFYKYKEKVKTHFQASKASNRIKFKTMFDEFAPGYYEIFYGKFYSRFAHGHFVTSIFRANFKSKKGELIYGCEYNNVHSNLVINQLFTFCYAYINFIELFFPEFSKLMNTKEYEEYLNNLTFFRSKILVPKDSEKLQDDFDKYVKPLIER